MEAESRHVEIWLRSFVSSSLSAILGAERKCRDEDVEMVCFSNDGMQVITVTMANAYIAV